LKDEGWCRFERRAAIRAGFRVFSRRRHEHGKTLFAQIMDFLPWTTFTRLVSRYGGDRYAKSLTCAEQFRVMAFAQLTYRESLRDIEVCLSAQSAKLYHMGFRQEIKRSTLADANESRDWRIHAEFAQRLIAQARKLYVGDSLDFELENTAYALDSTTIDLCLSVFPWAPFRTTKAAVKMHTLLDLRGNIPTFIHISDGKLHDVNVLDVLVPEAGAIYVMDRGYLDFERLHTIPSGECLLCDSAKSNMDARRVYSAATDRSTGIICDQTIALNGYYSSRDYPRTCAASASRTPRPASAGLPDQQLHACRRPPSARSTRRAGRSNCSSSGSSSIFGSNDSSVRRRTR
jgi:hypothetical protein